MMNRSVSQTREFSTVFMVEMWERFGYYGMAAMLVLFMIDKLGFADSQANLTWGAVAALVYAAPAIGGWIGDKVLGARRTMTFGALVLCGNYLMLSMHDDDLTFVYASLAVIVVGNGLFKANAANLVRRIYEGDDARIDSAFTMYYMAVNIGSTLSMLATPWIKDRWGWHAAFAVCCGVLRWHVARCAQSAADAPYACGHWLSTGRRTRSLEMRRRDRRGRHRTWLCHLVRAAECGGGRRLRIRGGNRDACHLRLCARQM
jgi:amino acid/peptide:H+ symporter